MTTNLWIFWVVFAVVLICIEYLWRKLEGQGKYHFDDSNEVESFTETDEGRIDLDNK
jgi:hypothetical protein